MKNHKKTTIAVVGGGSGGHITPVLSVAREIKRLDQDGQIVYIGQRGDRLRTVASDHEAVDIVRAISAGKFRRYHGESWLQRMLDLKTLLLNIRDIFRVIAGIIQAYRLLGRYRPQAIFIKGGFVGVPVGIAARLRGIPFVTHDSDAVAGLANRIIGRWAAGHATGMPKELYPYPQQKTIYTGVPIAEEYTGLKATDMAKYRNELGLEAEDQVLLVVGGGLGSAAINKKMIDVSANILRQFPKLHIFHVGGLQHEAALRERYQQTVQSEDQQRVHVLGFTNELVRYAAVADIVIGRGGATHLAEMAALSKACIIIPHPYLTGGHQLKNTQQLAQSGAVVSFFENGSSDKLASEIITLLQEPRQRERLGKLLHGHAKTDASVELAHAIVKLARTGAWSA